MHHQIQIPKDQISAFTKSGLWPNRLITEYLDENLVTIPDQPGSPNTGTGPDNRPSEVILNSD